MTPFGRFYSKLAASTLSARRQRNGTSTAEPQGSSCAFPTPLPFVQVLDQRVVEAGAKPFEIRRRRRQRSSKQFANLLVALLNFLELGWPKGQVRLDLGQGELNAEQQVVARRCLECAQTFGAGTGGEIPAQGRGRARLKNMIDSLGTFYGDNRPMQRDQRCVTVALPVTSDKVSLPAKAGQLYGADFMCEERAKVFRDLSVLKRDSEALPSHSVRPCHMIDAE